MDIVPPSYEGPYPGVPLSGKRARLLYEHAASTSRGWPVYDKGKELASKNYVKRSLARNQELKYHQTDYALVEAAYDNPIISAICNPSQGDGTNQRLGDQIKPKSIEIRGMVVSQDTTNYQRARVMVVQWFMDDTPTLGQLVGPDGATPSSTTVWESRNHDERQSSRILYDSGPINLASTASTTIDRSRVFNIKIKKKMRMTQFYASGLTGKGHLYLVVFSDAANADNDVYFLGNSCVYYTDKA